MNKIEVILDNPCEAYMPGTDVSGTVVLILKKSSKVTEILFSITGSSKVSWTESEYWQDSAGKAHAVCVVNESAERYFTYDNCLLSADGDFYSHLEGHHVFRFRYRLPSKLPSCFEGRHGHVRYQCNVTLKRKSGDDVTYRKMFSVNGLFDLNHYRDLANPFQGCHEKYLCCWCCRNGPLTCTVTLDRTAYVPGETIGIKVEIVNKTDIGVYMIKAKLLTTSSYFARSKFRYFGETISKVFNTTEVSAGSTEVISDIRILVPPVPPSRLIGCANIDLSYCVKLDFCVAGVSHDTTMLIPVIIGTIPFRHRFNLLEPSIHITPNFIWLHLSERLRNRQRNVRYFDVTPDLLRDYPEYPPPGTANYALGAFVVPHDDPNTEGPTIFIPQYLTYKVKNQMEI
ncbi:Uncharacterised protein g9075 [Pycnogonum litorale]